MTSVIECWHNKTIFQSRGKCMSQDLKINFTFYRNSLKQSLISTEFKI